MKLNTKYLIVSHCFILLISLFFSAQLIAQDTRFTVVLDAGHGGHDPGAQGSISREKDINLAVTLDLGAIIEQKYKDVKVIYSRKTDKYLTLQERADVVNSHHADLFICVHTNASQGTAAYGAESYTLGVDNGRTNGRTKGNLEVAMRENSVITLEDNYKTKYQGFDPNSVDSYIMFEFMQNKYIDRSVEFASTIQKQFRSYCNRFDRGVQQASFWVLYRSACPSVLVELGFISNPAEERYLSSELGQKEMASAIFNAFVDYKKDHDKKSGHQVVSVSKIEQPVKVAETPKVLIKKEIRQDTTLPDAKTIVKPQTQQAQPKMAAIVATDSSAKSVTLVTTKTEIEKPKAIQSDKEVVKSEGMITTKDTVKEVDLAKVFTNTSDEKKQNISKENISNAPVFKVQLLASAKVLKIGASDFKGLKNVDSFYEGSFHKYTIGAETDYSKIDKIRAEILSKFPEAFIIAFVGNKKISAKEALKLIK